MRSESGGLVARLTDDPTARYVYVGLLALLFLLAVGHLYAFQGLTTLYVGLPLWLWLQLAVVTVMLGVAWLAVGVRQAAIEGGD